MTDVAEQFVLLRTASEQPGSGQLQSATTGVDVMAGAVRLAVDEHGLPHMLVPVGDARVVRDAGSRGVVLEGRILLNEGRDEVFADLFCRDSRLTLVFEHLVEDALKRLSTAPSRPEQVLAKTLAEWRQLLQTAGASKLDRETAMGLVAELKVLALASEAAPDRALDAWKGPDREPHDFVLGRDALEVKATAAVDPNFVTISNLDQVDPSLVDRLRLVVVHLREDPNGLTLDDRIRGLIEQGMDKRRLLQRVSSYGYVYESGTEAPTFSLRGLRLWTVDEDFPGLRRSRISETYLRGVTRVSYQLDLDVAGQEPLRDQHVEEELRGWLA